MCSAANEDLSIVHSAFQVSAGIAKYGIHLGQHQFNRCFAQNGSIRELAKEETSGFNTPRRDRLAHSSCLLVDVIPGQVCTDYPSFLLSSGILHMLLALLACASEHGQANEDLSMAAHLGFYTVLTWLPKMRTVTEAPARHHPCKIVDEARVLSYTLLVI